jgi:hypothetical protein
MADHAKYSPSQLSRIIKCPGSVKLCTDIPSTTSRYAEEGTLLHKVMENTLNTRILVDPALDAHLAKEAEKHKLNKEQTRACEEALQYFKEVWAEARLEGIVSSRLEMKASLAYLNIPECYGTADVVIKTYDSLHIMDWKFGQGIEVSPKDNPQFMAYALGSVSSLKELTDYKHIHMHVVQPRLNNMYCVTHDSADALLCWCEETLRPALQAAETTAPCNPGEEQCRWCNAKQDCLARYEYAKQIASEVWAMHARKSTVKDEDLAALLEDAKFLKVYIADLEKLALERALDGRALPGYKVVHGRTSRSWADEEAAREYLLARDDVDFEDLFEQKFVTPPKAEKLFKGAKKDETLQALIHKTVGKPTLAKDSDPRKEYAPSAVNAFEKYADNSFVKHVKARRAQ